MAAFTIPAIFTAIDKFSGPVRGMSKSMEGFGSKVEAGVARSERLFRKLTPALSETSKQLLSFASTAAIAGAAIQLIRFSFNAIKDYDAALQSLKAITGLSGKEFTAFESKIGEVAGATKMSSIDVAKAFELIGSANSELLKSADAMGAVTKAAIILSQASGDDLATSASSLVGVMNQFSLGAEHSERVMNVLAAGAKVGAASISQVSESMVNVGAVAAGANISVEGTVALIETLSQKSLFGAEAGTKLRGAILRMQKAGVGYQSGLFNINDALEETKNKLSKLRTAKERDAVATKIFGAENITAGLILLDSGKMIDQFTKGVTGTSEATDQAALKNSSLSATLDQLTNKYVTIITTNGKVSSGVQTLINVVKFLTDNLETIMVTIVSVVGFFAVWKIGMMAVNGAMLIYNLTLGISTALMGGSLMALRGNTIALGAYKVVMGIVTAAQWLWNAAMSANPIALIIVGIAALIALVVVVIDKWNQWGAALSIFLGPLGMIISIIQSFRRNWEEITALFSKGDILGGLLKIGSTLLDALIMPLQQLLEIVAKLTGSKMAIQGVKDLQAFREKLGVNVNTDENGAMTGKRVDELINPQTKKNEAMSKNFEMINQSRVQIDVNDPNKNIGVKKVSGDNISIKNTSTMGYAF